MMDAFEIVLRNSETISDTGSFINSDVRVDDLF